VVVSFGAFVRCNTNFSARQKEKPMNRSASRFVCALISLAVSFGLTLGQAKKENSPEVRQKTFETIWRTVNEKYFDPAFGGVDWAKTHERYAARVAQVKSDAELFALLEEMLSELHTSHLEIVTPETVEKLKQKPIMVGMALKEIDGQVVIWHVWPNSSVAESRLRPGFVIKKIDGTPIEKVADAHRKMVGDAGTKLTVAYLNERDELRETTLERRPMPLSELEKENVGGGAALYGVFRTERLADGIGYISFTTFIGSLKKKVTEAIGSMRDAPGIIIDLRGNGGGDDSVGLALANMLFDKRTQLMITRTRKGDDYYYHAKPEKNVYLGPVVILLDRESASASEQFAAGLQEVGRATVIGNKTPGEDMDADASELPAGGFFVYPYGLPRTPKGVVIEGRGVSPNIEVTLTRASLLSGKDSQLEVAIEYIRKQKSMQNPAR
jgi:carboxyl-terminal processing protease